MPLGPFAFLGPPPQQERSDCVLYPSDRLPSSCKLLAFKKRDICRFYPASGKRNSTISCKLFSTVRSLAMSKILFQPVSSGWQRKALGRAKEADEWFTSSKSDQDSRNSSMRPLPREVAGTSLLSSAQTTANRIGTEGGASGNSCIRTVPCRHQWNLQAP